MPNKLKAKIVLTDWASVFGSGFKEMMKSAGVAVKRVSVRPPNVNAYVERFIQTIQQECLDHFVVFGAKHMDYLCKEFLEHYHDERPHQGLGNELARRPKRKKSRASGGGSPDIRRGGICRLTQT